jgi:hypothetical protein
VPKKPGLSAGAAISPPKAPIGDWRNLALSAALASMGRRRVVATTVVRKRKVEMFIGLSSKGLQFQELVYAHTCYFAAQT